MRSRKKPLKTEADRLVSDNSDSNMKGAGVKKAGREETVVIKTKEVPQDSLKIGKGDSKKIRTRQMSSNTTSKKSENTKKREANQMNKLSGQSDNDILAEIPELDEILELPKNIREEAFVRAVCTAHKAKLKANKKVKQNLAWLHTESEN